MTNLYLFTYTCPNTFIQVVIKFYSGNIWARMSLLYSNSIDFSNVFHDCYITDGKNEFWWRMEGVNSSQSVHRLLQLYNDDQPSGFASSSWQEISRWAFRWSRGRHLGVGERSSGRPWIVAWQTARQWPRDRAKLRCHMESEEVSKVSKRRWHGIASLHLWNVLFTARLVWYNYPVKNLMQISPGGLGLYVT